MKKKYVVILVIATFILSFAVSFAWFEWSSGINAQVFGEGCAPEISFVGGTTINGTGIRPVSSYDKGIRKQIDVNLENLCNNDTATMSLKMTLDVFPEGLADSSFKWVLYKTGTQNPLASGNFANKEEGETYTLVDQQVITGNVSTYTLYIYLDGNMDNPSSTQNKSFRIELFGEGRDAIYKEHVMKNLANTSATASFWGSNINANQVKSITFTKKSEKPNTVSGQMDVSSVENSNDVIMWYIENGVSDDETPVTLYDVYVGSDSGISTANTSMEKMFYSLSNCESIDAEGLDTSNVTSMKSLFFSAKKLTNILFSNWDTSNVENMQNMFSYTSIEYIDLSSLNTSNVTTMVGMFYSCTNLLHVNLSNLSNPMLEDTNRMFQLAGNSETTIDFSGFNTSNVSNMRLMFNGYGGKKLDLSGFDTSSVENMNSMFNGCLQVTNLDLSNFDFSGVTNHDSLMTGVPTSSEIIVNNCTQLNLLKNMIGNSYTNVHTINNDNCSV